MKYQMVRKHVTLTKTSAHLNGTLEHTLEKINVS